MELFGGQIHYLDQNGTVAEFCGNLKLNGSHFWKDRYCNNNFNNVLHAFVVLFHVTVVNQWHDILFKLFFYILILVLQIFFLNALYLSQKVTSTYPTNGQDYFF